MARVSPDYETFTMSGTAGGGFASVPFDDGGSYRAAAQVFASMGATLGHIADRAAARAGEAAGAAEAERQIALPETDFKVVPGRVTGLEKDDGRPTSRGLARGDAGPGPGGKGRVAQAMSFFRGKGWSAEQAAGIVGNLWQESGFAGDVIGGARRGDAGTAFGLGQWRGPRLTRLKAFAAAHGKPVTDFTTQLAFVHHELGTTELGAGQRLRAAQSVDDATAAMIGFERPKGWTAANPRGGHGWGNRLAFAQRALGGAAGPSGTAGPTLAGGEVLTAQPDMVTRAVYVAPPQPLALRRDGTIAGDAYDKAVLETASWRMRAGLEAELGQAYEDHKDDPTAYAKASQEVVGRYRKEAAKSGPELADAIERHAFERVQTYDQSVFSRAEKRAYDERNTAAAAALEVATRGLERQAYLIGTAEDGDERLARLSASANNAIDQAMASGAIDANEAQKQRNAAAGALAASRIQGVFDAIEDPAAKAAFVDGLGEAYADPASPLAALKPETFRRMKEGLAIDARQAADRSRASSALDKWQMKRALEDDKASLLATGRPGTLGGAEIDPARVAGVLGADDAAQWLSDREASRQVWSSVSTMPVMSEEEILAAVAAVEPKPGEAGFAQRQAVHEAVARRAEAVLKLRRDDPAQAAEEAFPELAREQDPMARAQRRMDAQAALGIDAGLRQPLTGAEARKYSDRLDMLEGNNELLDTEMAAIGGEVQKIYGPLADEAMGQVLQSRGLTRATALMGAAVMNRLHLGEMPPVGNLRAFDAARKDDVAAAAMEGRSGWRQGGFGSMMPLVAPGWAVMRKRQLGGRAMAPNTAQVNLLRSRPETAPQFEARFGAGSAAQYLQDRGEPARRALADGSLELRYEDGWREVIHPDGTIDGGMAP